MKLSTNRWDHIIFKTGAIILLFSAFVCSPLMTLNPELEVTQYVIDTWTIDDGLPQNTVSHIIQTHDGYLWIGTGNGLARFDGAGFAVFNMDNTPGFIGHDILQLIEDRDKNLWINTSQGINLYKNGEFKSFVRQEELKYWNKFFLDERRTLCAANKTGVFRFNNGRFEHIPNSSAPSGMDYVFIDKDGNSLFCTNKGVFQFQNS
jgi:hypothetical protein